MFSVRMGEEAWGVAMTRTRVTCIYMNQKGMHRFQGDRCTESGVMYLASHFCGAVTRQYLLPSEFYRTVEDSRTRMFRTHRPRGNGRDRDVVESMKRVEGTDMTMDLGEKYVRSSIFPG